MQLSKYKKIVFDYSLAGENESSKALIILGGMPGQPKTYPLFDELISKGYSLFYPHYEGTWDSEGEFLERLPGEAIDEFIEYLNSGVTLNGVPFRADNVYVISSSFGAWVALSLKDRGYVRKICLLSPVVSFRQVNGIDTLHDHIVKEYAADYRYRFENWNKLINDQLFSPLEHTEIRSNKIMIVAGKDDKQINVEDLSRYATKYSIKNFLVLEKGHITPSRIDENLISKILDFFEGSAF